MALIPGWYPPNRTNYEIILFIWKFFPLVASLQWAISWYGMGKTSRPSRLNIPGRLAWLTMECPGLLSLLYTLSSSPVSDLPWQNKVLAGLFCIHYSYRALLFPVLQPSMADIHVLVWGAALAFQLFNGTLIGSWLGEYGPTTREEWDAQLAFGYAQFVLGISIFYLGLAANYYHDDELRNIRRREMQRQKTQQQRQSQGQDGSAKKAIERHYSIPQAGLFKVMLYPHYFVEWIEWVGFWIACGWTCQPAMMFVVNEVVSMLPRAVRGRQWYIEKFGEEKIGRKWAIIPGVI